MSDNNEGENLTVSRVYETLRSPTFLKSLYWDILSGIKEKNTYKLMRGIAEKFINQNLEVLNDLGNDESDNIHRKTIIAEICSMTYAIDAVFSKILYLKLEKACKGQILNIIQQLKSEGKIPDSVWSKFKAKTQVPESGTSTENLVVNTSPARPKKDVPNTPTRVGTRKRKINTHYLPQEVKKVNSNKEILEDLRKVNGPRETDIDENSANNNKGYAKKKLGGRIKEFPKKNVPTPDTSTPLKLTKENVSLLNSLAESSSTSKPKDSHLTDNEDCNLTISSVHTSDLSSFDDEISLSSDDENGDKKKLSLKEVQRQFSKNGDSNSKQDKTNYVKSRELKVSVDDIAKSASKSAFSQSENDNGSSKRTRKPNSRYSSDNIICPVVKVKERKKTAASDKISEKNSSDEHSPKTKKSKVDSDDDFIVDVVTITQSINNEKSPSAISEVKTPPKQPVTLDMYKSHLPNRSLTSRRTAPVTLFST